jgi:hypothetical protein
MPIQYLLIFQLIKQKLKMDNRGNYNFIKNLVKYPLLYCRKKNRNSRRCHPAVFLQKPGIRLLNLKIEFNRLESKNYHVY